MKTSRCWVLVAVVAPAVLFGCQGSVTTDQVGEPVPSTATAPAPPAVDEPPVVTLTPKAAAMIAQHTAELSPTSKVYLRVRVVPGGCQGYMHKLDLDAEVTAADHVGRSEGVSVVTFKRQIEMLRGSQIDFGEENGKQGFKVENPNFKGEGAKKWLTILERETDIK